MSVIDTEHLGEDTRVAVEDTALRGFLPGVFLQGDIDTRVAGVTARTVAVDVFLETRLLTRVPGITVTIDAEKVLAVVYTTFDAVSVGRGETLKVCLVRVGKKRKREE